MPPRDKLDQNNAHEALGLQLHSYFSMGVTGTSTLSRTRVFFHAIFDIIYFQMDSTLSDDVLFWKKKVQYLNQRLLEIPACFQTLTANIFYIISVTNIRYMIHERLESKPLSLDHDCHK